MERCGGRLSSRVSALVAEDGGVDGTIEAGRSDVGLRTDPVVIDWLVGSEYEGVPLTDKDLNGINGVGVVVDTINFDNGLNLKLSTAMNFSKASGDSPCYDRRSKRYSSGRMKGRPIGNGSACPAQRSR
jgi:hypothetical protein